MSNENLHKANLAKNDEFYTQLTDIEKELNHYKEQLKGKIVYCNCDDPAWSNFVRYFIMQFNNIGLKGLIATGYVQGSGALTNQLNLVDMMQGKTEEDLKTQRDLSTSYYIDIKSVSRTMTNYFIENANRNLSNYDLLKFLKKESLIKTLKGDGDFRSAECMHLLKRCDVVITNPPFSLFREYISQLMEYNKQFLIIGNKNAITYKDVFVHIKNNKLWLGYNNVKTFINNKFSEQHFGNVGWYTNLEVSKRNEPLVLYKKYYNTEEDKHNPNYVNPEYPKYDNYDAIEVSRVADIPVDYDGVMGVPITFLDKYTPRQFEIEKFRKGNDDKDLTYTEKVDVSEEKASNTKKFNTHTHTTRKIQPYFRILIRRCRNR